MKPDDFGKLKEFALISCLLITSLCFFVFSGLLALVHEVVPDIFLWIAFVSLLAGLLGGAKKIISYIKEKNRLAN